MADSRQISVAFKFVDKGGGTKVLSASVESLQKVISATAIPTPMAIGCVLQHNRLSSQKFFVTLRK